MTTPSSEHGSYADLSDLQTSFDKQQEKISALKELVKKTEMSQGKSCSVHENARKMAQRLNHINSKVKARQSMQRALSETPLVSEDFSRTVLNTSLPSDKQSEISGSNKFLLLRQQIEQNKQKIAERESNKREFEEVVEQLKAKIDSNQQSLDRSSEIGRSMTDLSYQFGGTSAPSKYKSSSDLNYAPLNIDKERVKFLENRIRGLEKQLEIEKRNSDQQELKSQVDYLEHKILDLEENLKAKECIIEARTQAVGLISENYSIRDKQKIDLLQSTEEEITKIKVDFLQTEEKYQNEISLLKNELDEKNEKILNLEGIIEILEKNRFEMILQNSNPVANTENLQGANTSSSGLENIEKSSMDQLIEMKDEEIKNLSLKLEELEAQIMELTVENNVLKVNFSALEEKIKSSVPKSLFSKTTNSESEDEINKLKQNLDESNKSMIKLKLKTKQLQKQIDSYKKVSDVNNELICLMDKNQELQQKIVVLEDEKGQLQLQLLNNSGYKPTDSELLTKIEILESTCQNQTSAIQLLQEQKLEMNEIINQEKSNKNQMTEMLISETADSANETQLISDLQDMLTLSDSEKQNLIKKVEQYEEENKKLQERLNPSSSSAESIEIVERLTHQEKLQCELESPKTYTKRYDDNVDNISVELNDSLIKLREESADLMQKIELFTIERREVLEKMETMSAENQNNINKIEMLEDQKLVLENEIKNYHEDALKLTNDIECLKKEKGDLILKLETFHNQTVEPRLSASTLLIEKSKICLEKLNTEIDNFKKASDKNSKLQASKKLFKEAKNNAQQMEELLQKLQFETQTKEINDSEVERTKQINDLIAESEKYKILLDELNENIKEKEEKFHDLRNDKDELEKELENLKDENKSLKMSIDNDKQLCDSIEDLQRQVADYKEIIASNSQSIEVYKIELETLTNEIEQMKTNKNELKDEHFIKLSNEKIVLQDILKQNEESIEEISRELNNKQDTINMLNSQIMELYKSMEENSTKLCEKEDELAYLQEICDDKISEIERLCKENETYKRTLQDKLSEADKKQKNQHEIEDLKLKIIDLEGKNNALLGKNTEQLEKLKKFAANLKKKASQCTGLEDKIKELELKQSTSAIIDLSAEKIKEFEIRIESQEEKLKNYSVQKEQELKEMYEAKEIIQNDLILTNEQLKNHMKLSESKEIDNRQIMSELETKINVLQNSLQQQSLEFENVIASKDHEFMKINQEKQNLHNNLQAMNNELVEKTSQLDQLQFILGEKIREYDILKAEQEKQFIQSQQNIQEFERLFNVKENCIVENKKYIDNLLNELNANAMQLKTLQSLIDENNREIQILKLENETKIPESYVQELKIKYNYIFNEMLAAQQAYKYEFQNTNSRIENIYNDICNKFFDYETNSSKLLQENDILNNFIKTLENRGTYYRDQLNLNAETIDKDDKNILNRIKYLEDFENEMMQKCLSIIDENVKLKSEISNVQANFSSLQEHTNENTAAKFFTTDVQPQETNNEIIAELQKLKEENSNLKESLSYLENIKISYEREINWIRDQNANLARDQFELQELRTQIKYNGSEIENFKQLINNITQNHEAEIKMLQKQISEYDAIKMQIGQNQTDDQVFIENENKRLKELLNEKEKEIEMYKQVQNEQEAKPEIVSENLLNPTVSAFFSVGNDEIKPSYFDELTSTKPTPIKHVGDQNRNVQQMEERIASLENYVQELTNRIADLSKLNDEQLHQLQNNKSNLNELVANYENQIKFLLDKLKDEEIKNIENIMVQNNVAQRIVGTSTSLDFNVPEISDIPVVEEVIVPKRAYLCEPEDLAAETIELKNRIQELELEQSRYELEKKNLQIKFGKMVKKLKEYKSKIDESHTSDFKKSPSIELNSLDIAIQEEMTSQIAQLEQKLVDVNQSLDLEKSEKQNLLKRLEGLSDANNRIVEMKNQHEVEMQDLRIQIRELNKKLKNLEDWDFKNEENDEENNDTIKESSRIESGLLEEIKELKEQQRDMEILLQDKSTCLENLQRELNVFQNSYETKSSEGTCCLAIKLELNELKIENENLKLKLSDQQNIISNLEVELISMKKNLSTINSEHQNKLEEISKLNADLEVKIKAYENTTKEINIQLETVVNENNQLKMDMDRIQEENNSLSNGKKEETSLVNNEYDNMKLEMERLLKEKFDLETELQSLNDYVLNNLNNEEKLKELILELDLKNIENTELKNKIEVVQNSPHFISNLNAEASQEKVKLEMNESSEFLNSTDDSDSVQRILENQELEIVTLKEQLALRSAEYARLAAQHDPFALNLSSPEVFKTMGTTDFKAELDLTLYRLHQRDMQCEEMKLELMNLLQERDTLQLRLSNAIRSIEEMKTPMELSHDLDKLEENMEQYPTTSTSATSFQNVSSDIDIKLSQLHSAGYVKQLETRQHELEKMQQDVAKIPSEALEQLTTNLESGNSGSSILNWFWGKPFVDSS